MAWYPRAEAGTPNINLGVLERSIKWIDESVDTGTVSTGGNIVDKVTGIGNGGKVGSVSVELEVTLGWVMWVDEWVKVGVNGSST